MLEGTAHVFLTFLLGCVVITVESFDMRLPPILS